MLVIGNPVTVKLLESPGKAGGLPKGNYSLYADMSHRVMTILDSLVPAIEIYSIDEAFVDVWGIPDLHAFGTYIRKIVLRAPAMLLSLSLCLFPSL